jgi:hypothetical protein
MRKSLGKAEREGESLGKAEGEKARKSLRKGKV